MCLSAGNDIVYSPGPAGKLSFGNTIPHRFIVDSTHTALESIGKARLLDESCMTAEEIPSWATGIRAAYRTKAMRRSQLDLFETYLYPSYGSWT